MLAKRNKKKITFSLGKGFTDEKRLRNLWRMNLTKTFKDSFDKKKIKRLNILGTFFSISSKTNLSMISSLHFLCYLH